MNENYPTTACEVAKVSSSTVTETLFRRRDRLQRELEAVDGALEALKANPEIERVMNLVSKATHF